MSTPTVAIMLQYVCCLDVRLPGTDSLLHSITVVTDLILTVGMYVWVPPHGIVLENFTGNHQRWKISSSYVTWAILLMMTA